MAKRTDDYIEVSTSCRFPEFPTRVKIIAFDGTFEHADDNSAPKYTYSVQVEVKYNKVVDGKEENLATFKFWTKEDFTVFSFDDDDLDEDSVDDWFWEGLSEDLSNHGLEGLENIDIHASFVSSFEDDEPTTVFKSVIARTLNISIPEKWNDFDYKSLYPYEVEGTMEAHPFSKTEEIVEGKTKTTWSIEGFELAEDMDMEEGIVITASMHVKGELFIDGELLLTTNFWSDPLYLMHPCQDGISNAIKIIEEEKISHLVGVRNLEPLSKIFLDYDDFVVFMEQNDSLEDVVETYIRDSFDIYENHDGIDVVSGPLAHKWMESLNDANVYEKREDGAYVEKIHIGVTTTNTKVVGTIEFEEEDLIREGLGAKLFNGKLDLYRRNYYIGEWLVDLWGRDRKGTLISECSFGGYDEAEWEGETSLDILRFWKLTKVETKERRGRLYYVIYSGKRHWDIDEELYQCEEDFLPVVFSLATDPANDVEFEQDGIYYIANDFDTVAVDRPDEVKYKGCVEIPSTVTSHKKTYKVTEIRNMGECEELIEVKLPNTITKIAEGAFHPDENLKKINFPDSLETIEESAFWGCTSLEKVILPKRCYVGKSAFAFCEGIKELIMSEQRIPAERSFRNCTSLTSVVLPPTTWRMDQSVFENCKNLKEVVLNEGLESFSGNCFSGCAIQELRIPKSVIAVYGPFGCKSLKEFYVDPENDELRSVDGVLYSENMKELKQCPEGREGEFVIPDGVVYIGSHAFYHCSQITKIVIPDSVEFIGWKSFYYCENLQTVVIGNGVKQIDEEAFSECKRLSSIKFGSGLEKIGGHAFRYCEALTEVHLPASIKSYHFGMFAKCTSLSVLTMPEWMEKHRKDIMDYACGKHV